MRLHILGIERQQRIADDARADEQWTHRAHARKRCKEQAVHFAALGLVSKRFADAERQRRDDGKFCGHTGNQRSNDRAGRDDGSSLRLERSGELAQHHMRDARDQPAFLHAHAQAERREQKPPRLTRKRCEHGVNRNSRHRNEQHRHDEGRDHLGEDAQNPPHNGPHQNAHCLSRLGGKPRSRQSKRRHNAKHHTGCGTGILKHTFCKISVSRHDAARLPREYPIERPAAKRGGPKSTRTIILH